MPHLLRQAVGVQREFAQLGVWQLELLEELGGALGGALSVVRFIELGIEVHSTAEGAERATDGHLVHKVRRVVRRLKEERERMRWRVERLAELLLLEHAKHGFGERFKALRRDVALREAVEDRDEHLSLLWGRALVRRLRLESVVIAAMVGAVLLHLCEFFHCDSLDAFLGQHGGFAGVPDRHGHAVVSACGGNRAGSRCGSLNCRRRSNSGRRSMKICREQAFACKRVKEKGFRCC